MRWACLPLAALISFAGCASDGLGDAPECPPWTLAAIEDLEHMQALDLYPELEIMIGMQERHCMAIEAWNGKRNEGCHPDGFAGWVALVLSLECSQ